MYSCTHTHTHTHTHYHTLSHTHTHSHTLTCTHTHSLTLTHTHTLTHTIIHSHTLSHVCVSVCVCVDFQWRFIGVAHNSNIAQPILLKALFAPDCRATDLAAKMWTVPMSILCILDCYGYSPSISVPCFRRQLLQCTPAFRLPAAQADDEWGRFPGIPLHPPGVNVIKLFSFVADDEAK